MHGQYILSEDGITPIPCDDIKQWGQFMETPARVVKLDHLPDGRRLSTVFLGLDYSFGGGEPILWESMLFPSDEDGKKQWRDLDANRCGGDRHNAERMHAEMLAKHTYEH